MSRAIFVKLAVKEEKLSNAHNQHAQEMQPEAESVK